MSSVLQVNTLIKNNDAELQQIGEKILAAERITPAEGLLLFEKGSLSYLGALANFVREKLHGNKTYFNRNFHIEPTNVCVFSCAFCAYSKLYANRGHRGCLEALAGGWAIARRAREAIRDAPAAGKAFLQAAGLKEPVAPEDVNAGVVAAAARAHDPLARLLVDEVARALIAGTVSLVNAFNPCRLILGGGVMQGLPELTGRIEAGIRRSALNTAIEGLEVLPARLKGDAGVVGAATLAIRSFAP